jgi:hypothetical protein
MASREVGFVCPLLADCSRSVVKAAARDASAYSRLVASSTALMDAPPANASSSEWNESMAAGSTDSPSSKRSRLSVSDTGYLDTRLTQTTTCPKPSTQERFRLQEPEFADPSVKSTTSVLARGKPLIREAGSAKLPTQLSISIRQTEELVFTSTPTTPKPSSPPGTSEAIVRCEVIVKRGAWGPTRFGWRSTISTT